MVRHFIVTVFCNSILNMHLRPLIRHIALPCYRFCLKIFASLFHYIVVLIFDYIVIMHHDLNTKDKHRGNWPLIIRAKNRM